MNEAILAGLFAALVIDICVWIAICVGIFRRLRRKHPDLHARLFGTPLRRKNEMDRLFSLVGFLASGKSTPTGDQRLSLYCILLKVCSALFAVIFISMMFAPMFLRQH